MCREEEDELQENRNSFSTGEPANSGFKRMQLKIKLDGISQAGCRDDDALEKVRQASMAAVEESWPKSC